MEKQYEKKITWTIKSFSTLESEKIYSDQFVVGGCKWSLSVYPKGYSVANQLSLSLEVVDYGTLPTGWRRHARYLLTVVNQHSEKLSRQHIELQHLFHEKSADLGFLSMIPLNELQAEDSGFLVNDELKVAVEIEVLELIGKVDVTEETSTITETMSVNGFQLLPSQAKSVSSMFERHPDIASDFLPENRKLRAAYMSFLLGLIETMCQSPKELSKDDLSRASSALGFMTEAGFKLDWLEKKLDELSKNKENGQASETKLQGLEVELMEMKLKCASIEALVEKEKAIVTAAKTPLSFNDVV